MSMLITGTLVLKSNPVLLPLGSFASLISKFLSPSRTESSTIVRRVHCTSPVDCPAVKISTDGSGPMKSTPSTYKVTIN